MVRQRTKTRGGRRHGLSASGSTPPLLVRLTPEQRTWVATRAKRTHCSLAEVVRQILQQHMEEQ